ncbi:putative holin-like toxin [Veillonella sp.]
MNIHNYISFFTISPKTFEAISLMIAFATLVILIVK